MPAPISLQDRTLIYRTLAAEFGHTSDIPLAAIGLALRSASFEQTRYGYAKLKPFLEQFELSCEGGFLTFTDVVQGGVPQRLATIHEQGSAPVGAPVAEPAGSPAPASTAPTDTPAGAPVMVPVTSPAPAAAPTGVPTPGSTAAIARPQFDDAAEHQRPQPEASPKATAKAAPKGAAKALSPSKEIERFAWLGPWSDLLEQLADFALDEQWDFQGAPDEFGHRRAILKSYLCTTFFRLKSEGKVSIADDKSFAAFNTGLVNDRYDDIFACFEPSFGESPWKFAGFTAAGSRGLGKKLVSLFNPLPEAASYFTRKEDMLFDLDKELIVDYEHIIVDNMERLPIEFLEEEMHGCREAEELLAALRGARDWRERKSIFAELGRIVEEDAKYFRRLRNSLEDAVETACRRVRWNFKTAIPSYYPRANAMSLLLPLDVTEDNLADAALVVQLMPSGNYQGQTILTMRQAYANARLICRPDSDWLTTSSQTPTSPDEADER